MRGGTCSVCSIEYNYVMEVCALRVHSSFRPIVFFCQQDTPVSHFRLLNPNMHTILGGGKPYVYNQKVLTSKIKEYAQDYYLTDTCLGG